MLRAKALGQSMALSARNADNVNVDIENLVDLEQQFYDVGFADGFEHGAVHGRIEGRALGCEKGFEMWEELGFYEGFASLCLSISTSQGSSEGARINHNGSTLLELIAQFPTTNPSYADTSAPEVDIPRLFNQIRSRYKMLCTSVGVKPSLRASNPLPHTQTKPGTDTGTGAGVVPGEKINTDVTNGHGRVEITTLESERREDIAEDQQEGGAKRGKRRVWAVDSTVESGEKSKSPLPRAKDEYEYGF